MSAQTRSGSLPVTVDAAYAQYTLMAIDAANCTDTKVAATAATASSTSRQILGYLTQASFASGDERTVQMLGMDDTFPGIASAAISRGAQIKAGASGKTDPASGTGVSLGIALQTASAANQIIECKYNPS